MPLADYAAFARSQFMNLSPGDAKRSYANGWRGVLHDIYRAGGNAASPGGLFEAASIVVSRWEFLGALYSGETQHDTKARHAALYAKRFLPQYANVHNLSGDPNCQTDALYRRAGDQAKAHEHLTTATTMYREMGMAFWLEKAEAEHSGGAG